MTRTPRGRTLALVAAVGVVAVAAVAAARWEQLATRYYLYRLESDEEYLEQLVDSPELSTAQTEALRTYCETDEGGGALVNLFVSEACQAVDRQPEDLRTWDFVDIGLRASGTFYLRLPKPPGLEWVWGSPAHQSRVLRLERLLKLAAGGEFPLDRCPSVTVRVLLRGRDSKPVVRAVRIAAHTSPVSNDPPP